MGVDDIMVEVAKILDEEYKDETGDLVGSLRKAASAANISVGRGILRMLLHHTQVSVVAISEVDEGNVSSIQGVRDSVRKIIAHALLLDKEMVALGSRLIKEDSTKA